VQLEHVTLLIAMLHAGHICALCAGTIAAVAAINTDTGDAEQRIQCCTVELMQCSTWYALALTLHAGMKPP
jgi:hypothetical protein